MWSGLQRSVASDLIRRLVSIAVLSLPVRALAADTSPGPTSSSKASSSKASSSKASSSKASERHSPTSVRGCVDDHVAGQALRQDGKFIESRERFLHCSQEQCPELVRGECLRMLDELRAQVPSVIFRVTVDGESQSDVAAFIGDRQIFSEIPARAMEFDPGKYRFRFKYRNLAAIERDIIIAEGDRFMPISVTFVDPARLPTKDKPASYTPTDASAATRVERRPVPWPVFALASVGVVGLGSFVGFGLASVTQENSLKSTCAPECSKEQIDSVRTLARIADIYLGVGIAAFAVATTVYVLRPTEVIRVGAAAHPSGGVLSRLEVDF